MRQRFVACLCFVLVAGLGAAQDKGIDTTPPELTVLYPGPCQQLGASPLNVNGVVADQQSGIASVELSMVRDEVGLQAHGWETWDGQRWHHVDTLESAIHLPVDLDVAEYRFVTVDPMPSVATGTLRSFEKVHILVTARNGYGLTTHWISCFMVVKTQQDGSPQSDD